MKIAEALLLRADMQKKLASLRERIGQYAVVQEGSEPHEDPAKLLDESMGVLKELESLIFRINQANLTHKLPDGRSLTAAIARRETLVAQHALLQHAIASTKKEPDRYSMSEIKWIATLKVSSLQKQSEDLAKSIREINGAIQEANWKAELEG
ncbi:DIP1984 family protein [Anatilimnocola sp. NA78]|uniref:DIP1984 family protein n=1 Tax=Anatilimnocola sp. NA78 TaxID=3415683 RepID=UPI003CE570DC